MSPGVTSSELWFAPVVMFLVEKSGVLQGPYADVAMICTTLIVCTYMLCRTFLKGKVQPPSA